MTLSLFLAFMLFCVVVGYGMADWGANWWMLAAITLAAAIALQASYVATSILRML